VPPQPRAHLDGARRDAEVRAQAARWELHRLANDLSSLPNPPILLKGAAYLLAAPRIAAGRTFNDLDILVPAADLGSARAALERAGWSVAALAPYDVDYYERWAHELPPMRHPARRFELDVHHGLLPVAGRVRPPMAAVLEQARPVDGSPFAVLSPVDGVIHAALHLCQDSDFDNRLRDLFDILHLIDDGVGRDPAFAAALVARSRALRSERPLWYALALCARFFDRRWPEALLPSQLEGAPSRLLAGPIVSAMSAALRPASVEARREPGRAASCLALYVRSLWLRMPPGALLRHLATKARMRTGREPGQ
jgi:hypothetical protein